MFESSLVASQQRHMSSTQRWTAFASIAVQAAIAATIITLPLLHPERLIPHTQAPRFIPMFKMPKPPIIKIEQAASSVSTRSAPQQTTAFTAPTHIPTLIHMGPDPGPAPQIPTTGMSNETYDPLATMATSVTPHVAVTPTHPAKPMPVSTGVMDGMLLSPIRPIYPPIAKAAHVEGTVVVEAIISKSGTIESLHVVSGSPMLQQAAIEAIQTARYRPYRLNGEPTEVQTRITVNFRFGS